MVIFLPRMFHTRSFHFNKNLNKVIRKFINAGFLTDTGKKVEMEKHIKYGRSAYLLRLKFLRRVTLSSVFNKVTVFYSIRL